MEGADEALSRIPMRLLGGLQFDLIGPESDPVIQGFLATGSLSDDCPVPLAQAFAGPGKVVLDVGAHLGTFTLAMARAGCQVIAIEASPQNVQNLRASIEHNGLAGRVRIIHAAAGNSPGVLSFYPSGPHGQVCPRGTAGSVEVPAGPIPDLLASLNVGAIDFIKIDIEGWETEAVEGMRGWVHQVGAPPIVYESNHYAHHYYGRSSLTVRKALAAIGYSSLYRARPSRRELIAAGPDDFHEELLVDYLATPRPLTAPDGWRVLPRIGVLQAGEALQQMLTASHLEPAHKAAYATALRGASARYLRHPIVRNCLEYLRTHPDGTIRNALGWYTPPPWWSLGDALEQLQFGLRRVARVPYHAVRRRLRAS
jgi:FkbM family methyltransferase